MSDAIKLAIEALEGASTAKLSDGTYLDKDCKITLALAALRARPDHSELVRDSERLNWLEENCIRNVRGSTDGPAYKHLQFAGKIRADWTFDVGNMPLREAIDKAADALEKTK